MEKAAVILIVDDMPEQLRAMASVLKGHGYSIRSALSGIDALRLMEREIPDLVLLDIQMEDMDGYTVCRTLRSNSRYEDTAILFITAAGDREVCKKALKREHRIIL